MPTPLYATKAAWLTGLKNWLNTDDQPDADTNLFLYLAQLRLNRELQSVPMEASVDHPITALEVGQPLDLLTIIPDFNKIRLVLPYANAEPADVIAINEMMRKKAIAFQQGVSAARYDTDLKNYYCIDARKLYIHPWPLENSVVTIKYYVDVPFLTTTTQETNIFSNFHSDLLLYAALLAGSQFIVEDERVSVFESAYAVGLESTNNTGKHQNMGSTVLKREITGLS